MAAGNLDEARRWARLARQSLEEVADPEDREVIAGQVTELGLE
jgi:hypothetical protein